MVRVIMTRFLLCCTKRSVFKLGIFNFRRLFTCKVIFFEFLKFLLIIKFCKYFKFANFVQWIKKNTIMKIW